MILLIFLLCASCMGVSSINRPVYKIVLNQKGYAQFLQYDIETPPLREFTFCTWFRIYDLFGDQTIFSYIANSNNRVVRLWLDSEGRQMKVSINGGVTSSSTVDIVKDVWRHVCLSYQSDYGALALYLDARLVACEVAQSLQGYVLPEGGSVIVGYGTDDNGAQNGLEGEIFGANMFLVSTIEKNYTMRNDPQYKQRSFKRNKVKVESDNVKYVVLKDLQTGELKYNIEMTHPPVVKNSTRNFIKFRTPHSYIEHDVGVHLMPTKPVSSMYSTSEEKEILDFPTTTHSSQTAGNSKLWNFDHIGKFKIPTKVSSEPSSGTVTQDFVMLSEYETPPPVSSTSYSKATFKSEKPFVSKSLYKLSSEPTEPGKSLSTKVMDDLSEYETPPPVDKNTKVYGQWTSSKFAGNVLNHLKNIQFHSKDQKKLTIPPTIPLIKTSDSFPYSSDFKITKLRPPPQFQRKNIVERRFDRLKKSPQINVQILEEDLRNNILKSHAQTQLKHVDITNRGITKQHTQHRFYRNIDSQDLDDPTDGSSESTFKPRPFSKKKKQKDNSNFHLHTNNLISILPFLKSLEYFTEDTQATESNDLKSNKMYTKSLSGGNKWHNVKSYSNDYTPRKINVGSEDGNSGIHEKLADPEKKHPSVLLNYKHEHRKVMPYEEESILKGRELALKVSNQSDYNKDSISILKYNHGFLPGHKVKIIDKPKSAAFPNIAQLKYGKRGNFNEHVKIGNALNERKVIGVNEEQQKHSFVGGDDSIPDINKYRSDIDNEYYTGVPPSLRPRICKNVELFDRVLYVQPDESIDMTHIFSPVKAKNLGIEFVMQNYKKCSLEESNLQGNEMLFIDWSKTPVRLFGGAYPIKTTDLCGFF